MVQPMVARSEPAANFEHKGYNRGLILGLTMAESMLLLVFCLLLVAAAIIKAEQNKALQAQLQLEALQKRVAEEKVQSEKDFKQLASELAALQAQLQSANIQPAEREKFEKEWRDLVLARDTVQRLKDQGLEPEHLAELEKALAILKDNGFSTADAKAMEKRLHDLLEMEQKQADAKPHQWPPIINLSEAGGYFFRSGSAELTPEFEDKLTGAIADQIAQNLEQYQVDIIEVIGHTDEQPISRTVSNLDQSYIDVLKGKKPVASVLPADNAGLGLARAIAVANVLKADKKLVGATILPMSAAQLVLPGDTLTKGQAGNVESRRRIEIRIRRRNASLTP
ncbi:OmpA family protein [Sinorhizobium fredii]|uniref:OmpA family protein n=2 Tax=Rhizobium fredii TaxID=380 RepID=UPI000683F66F|nr:OmpA family protein [Sinorhizobium fredii]